MKPTGIVRKVDELGRVVLPIETRMKLGINERDALEIFEDEEEGRIVLQKAQQTCIKCKATEGLKKIRTGCYICEKCLAELQ